MPRLTQAAWVEAETLYRSGTMTLGALAERFGCHESAIKRRAKQLGWVREPAETKRRLVEAKLTVDPAVVNQKLRDVLDTEANRDVRVLQEAADLFEKIIRDCASACDLLPVEAVGPREVIAKTAERAHASYRKARGLEDKPSEMSEFEASVIKMRQNGEL